MANARCACGWVAPGRKALAATLRRHTTSPKASPTRRKVAAILHKKMSAAPVSAGTWDALKLHPTILDIVKNKLNFMTMTPVQAHAIPPFLSYKDVAVEMLLRRKEPLQTREVGAIIISPTRELATQISRVVSVFTESLAFKSLLLIGGAGMQEDLASWRKHGANILIGTPGRMLYFLEEVSDVKLRELDVLILDEADRLLDLGFEVALNSILAKLPKQRRTGLFSATQTKEVEELVRAGLRNPMYIQVKVENKLTSAPQKIPSTLQNFVMKIPNAEKLSVLVHFLKTHPRKKFIIYFLTCACVDYFWLILSQLQELKGLRLNSLHGKVPPAKRSAIFRRFVDAPAGEGAVLMTTDVAARGLDLPDVDWIIQYDLPQDPQMFVHRIGRTARMGREGQAVTFITPEEDAYIAFLQKGLEVPVEEMPAPEAPSMLETVREMALKDYQIVKKSFIAIVSYVRAYREHKCNYLLPWKLLDFGSLATGFCLLKLPRMPELQGKELSSFEPVDVDLNSIPYKDAIMEKQRRAKLAAQEARRKEAEQEAPSRKRPAPVAAKPSAAAVKKEKEDTSDSDDEEEILRDYARMKKQKKHKKRGWFEDEEEEQEGDEQEDEEGENEESEAGEAEEEGEGEGDAAEEQEAEEKQQQQQQQQQQGQQEEQANEGATGAAPMEESVSEHVESAPSQDKKKKKRKKHKAAFVIPLTGKK